MKKLILLAISIVAFASCTEIKGTKHVDTNQDNIALSCDHILSGIRNQSYRQLWCDIKTDSIKSVLEVVPVYTSETIKVISQIEDEYKNEYLRELKSVSGGFSYRGLLDSYKKKYDGAVFQRLILQNKIKERDSILGFGLLILTHGENFLVVYTNTDFQIIEYDLNRMVETCVNYGFYTEYRYIPFY